MFQASRTAKPQAQPLLTRSFHALILLFLLGAQLPFVPATPPAASAARAPVARGNAGPAGARLRFGPVAVTVPPEALRQRLDLRVERLQDGDLPPLEPGMINATAGDGGYRFLPAGTTFEKPVQIEIPLKPAFVGAGGQGVAGVRTYYWDRQAGRWTPLAKLRVDAERGSLISEAHHFTTMINAVLSRPDSPPPLSFNPNTIKDIAAVKPDNGIDLISMPQANQQGTASLSYPLRLPEGRGSHRPQLALTYDSSRPNGWLGVGWDLPVPRVEVDTRWGVPAYDGTERYLYKGDALVPIPTAPHARCMAPGTTAVEQFAPRVDSFDRILKCTTPGGTHWEVTGKSGTRLEYGTDAASRLASYHSGEGDHVAIWHLRRAVDPNGNVTRYGYFTDAESGGGEPFVQTYLRAITYTAHLTESIAPAYRVRFNADCTSRDDIGVSGRYGFKTVTRCRLADVQIELLDGGTPTPIRSYTLSYTTGAFAKSLLAGVTAHGADGSTFYEHTFDYTDPQSAIPFEATATWPVTPTDVGPLDDADRLLDATLSEGHATSFGVGAEIAVGGGGAEAGCSVGIKGEAMFTGANPVVRTLDVNGDRIADRIWAQGNSIRVLLGEAQRPGGGFDGPHGTTHLPFLGSQGSRGGSVGVNGGCSVGPASVSGGMSFSVRRADTFWLLTDADGDGRTDLTDGTALFRGLPHTCRDGSDPGGDGTCPDGLPACPDPGLLCFAPVSTIAGTSASAAAAPQQTLTATEAISWSYDTAAPMQMQAFPDLAQEMYKLDPVIRWDAWHTGQVSATVRARRKYLGGADGVSVTLAYVTDPTVMTGTQVLGELALGPNDAGWATVPGSGLRDLDFGESLVVVVDTVDQVPVSSGGAWMDEIDLEIHIEYRRVCPLGQPCRALAPGELDHRDATGQRAYVFDFPGDMRTSELPRLSYWTLLPPLGPPRQHDDGSGEDHNIITGTVAKLAATDTPVHIRVRCESANTRHAYDGSICPMGSLWAYKIFTPTETGSVPITVPLPSPFHETYRIAGTRTTDAGNARAFFWSPENPVEEPELIDLGTLGGLLSEANDANDAGQVVGGADTLDGDRHAFLWTAERGMRDLGTLGGKSSVAHAINADGLVAGASEDLAGATRAFLWREGHGMIDLGTLGGMQSRAFGINDAGQVVGSSTTGGGETHAFLWADANDNGQSDPGEMQDLGTLSIGGSPADSIAVDVNQAGQVAGYLEGAEIHAFLWTPGGSAGPPANPQMQDLGTLGGGFAEASALDDAGRVVGQSYGSDGEPYAFLWTADQGMQSLGLGRALDINAFGQVVGEGLAAGSNFIWTAEGGRFDLGLEAAVPMAINDPLVFEPIRVMFEVDGENGAEVPPDAIAWNPTLRIVSVYDLSDVQWPDPEASQVAGDIDGLEHAGVWVDTRRDGQWQADELWDLGALPGGESRPEAINGRGQVVGRSVYTTAAPNEEHAFLWSPVDQKLWDDERRMLDITPPFTNTVQAWANDINDRGQIVGVAYVDDGSATVPHGFVTTLGGGILDFGPDTTAEGINNLGQVVGTRWDTVRAFRWSDADGDGLVDPGEMEDLGTLGGGASQASDINDSGAVVGNSDLDAGGSHAFLWTEKGGMVDLGTLGGTYSWAYAINQRGQVVGDAETSDDVTHPILWTQADGMTDLYPQAAGVTTLNTAFDINERGQVVGMLHQDDQYQMFLWENGQLRVFDDGVSASGISNGTVGDFALQEDAVFLDPEQDWIETPRPLFRVHPARQLWPFRTFADDQVLEVAATIVDYNYYQPLTVNVLGDDYEGPLHAETVGLSDVVPGNRATTKRFTTTLPTAGLYYVRGYAHATYSPFTSMNLSAKLLGLRSLALVHEVQGGGIVTYTAINTPTTRIAVEEDTPWEFLARAYFPQAQIILRPTLAEAVEQLVIGEAIVVLGEPGALRDQLQDPTVDDAAFLCCTPSDPQPLDFSVPVRTNLLTAQWGAGWRSAITMPARLQELPGEVHYAFEPYAGGHHGFFYGQFNGGEALTCLGPDPCTDAPAARARSIDATQAITLPISCESDHDDDGLPDCIDPQPYPCTAELEVNPDVNDDGRLDILDIIAVNAAFGTNSGDPGWDPALDLNNDGQIDDGDVHLAAQGWRQDPQAIDRDGDGIPDCADDAVGEPEDFDGDDDGDGAPDRADNDRDGDGVPDLADRCPLSPEDFDGDRDGDGCPDRDRGSQNGSDDDPDGDRDLGPGGDPGQRTRRFEPMRSGGGGDDQRRCFVGSDPSARVCDDGSAHPSRNGGVGGGGDGGGDGDGAPPGDGVKRSWTMGANAYIAAGISLGDLGIPVSLNASFVTGVSLTYGDRDYLDWNGDGVADRHSPNVVTLVGLDEEVTLGVDCVLEIDGLCFLRPAIHSSYNGTMGFALGGGSGGSFDIKTDANGNVISQGWSNLNFGLNAHASQSRTINDRFDVNGDGLPDIVYTDPNERLMVRLNLGYRLGAPEDWGSLSLPAGNNPGTLASQLDITDEIMDLGVPNYLYRSDNLATGIAAGVSVGAKVIIFGGGFTGGRSESANLVQMPHRFVDLNGDGLMDLVMKNAQDQTLYVRYNRGAGLDAGVVTYGGIPAWGAPPQVPEANTGLFGEALDWINDARTESPDALNVSGSTSERMEGTIEELVFGVKSTQSYKHVAGQQLLELTLRDVNGDGLPDRVLRSGQEAGATIQVQENRFAGANLLQTVHRPLGGRIDLAYEQRRPTPDDPNARWVLAATVLRNDDTFPAAHRTTPMTGTFTYENPYYDRFEREFLGFQIVRVTRPDGRVDETLYAHRDYRLQGKVLRRRMLGGDGTLYQERAFSYAPTRTVTGTPAERQACLDDLRRPLAYLATGALDAAGRTPCDVWFSDPVSTTLAYYEGGSAPQRRVRVYTYDDYGNVTGLHDHQDAGDPHDDLFVTVAFSHTPALLDAHIVDRARSIDVRQGSSGGPRLRFRRGSYDARGNLIAHAAFNDSAGNQITTLDLAYDAAGYVTAITDTAGYVVTYTPDAVIHRFDVAVVDNFGLGSAKQYDFRFQKPLLITDTNGQVRANRYDTYGRITAVQGPYELAAGQDSVQVDYSHLAALPAYVVTTNQAVRPGESAILTSLRTAVFMDGMDRVIQRQMDAEVDGQIGRQVSGRLAFDGAGRRVREGLEVFRAGTTIQFEPLSFVTNRFTQWAFDPMDRATRITRPGNRVTTKAYSVTTASAQPAISVQQTRITDPNGEVRLLRYDAADHLVAVVQRLDGRDLVTRYDYRPTGELITVTDALSRTTAVAYDLVGRRIAVTTPDAGRLELGYDANGNLIERTDQVLCPHSTDLLAQCGAGEKIRYQYDRNRLLLADFPNTADVSYVYGDTAGPGQCAATSNAQGRICAVQDGGGSEARGYGALGEVTLRARTVPDAPGGAGTRTFTTTFLYDSFGRMLQMTYPDGERLSYAYDAGGRVRSVTGVYSASITTYVQQMLYNEFGELSQAIYGSGAVTSTYQYEPDTRRLDLKQIASQAAPALLRETDYSYDPVGNILAVQDTRAAADPFLDAVTQHFAYDDLHRVTAMTMTATGSPTTTTYVTNTLAYDDVGNLITQTVDRRENATPLPGYPSRDWAYAYGDPAHPNLPNTIGPYSFTYDARGSILTSSRSSGDAPAGATYTWDDLGRLATSQREGGTETTGYTYTWEGERLRKQTPLTVTGTVTDYDITVYPNPYYTARFAQEPVTGCAQPPCWDEIVSRSKHVYVNEERVAVWALVVDPATAGNGEAELAYVEQVPQFLHSDPVYSTVLLTGEDGERMQEIEYLPFGEVLFDRSAADNAGLPQPYRFDGKELDPETGLQYFGARYYDPRMGRWISADPLYRTRPDMSVENPKNLNLFAFAQNNPVRIFDRDGRQSQEEEGAEPFKEGEFHGPVERPAAQPFDIDRFMEKHEEETRENWMGDTVYTRVLGEDGQPIEDKDKYFGGRVIEEKPTTYRIEGDYAVMRQEYVVKTYVRKKVRDPETGEVRTVVTMEKQTRVTEMWIQFPEDPEQREISRRAWTAKKRGVSSFDPSAIADMANLPDASFPPVSKFGETLDESQFFDAAQGLSE